MGFLFQYNVIIVVIFRYHDSFMLVFRGIRWPQNVRYFIVGKTGETMEFSLHYLLFSSSHRNEEAIWAVLRCNIVHFTTRNGPF